MCRNMNDNDYSLLTANTKFKTISVANNNLDGTGTTSSILTSGGDNGTIIKSVIIKAIQATTVGMVRLFIANSGASIVTLYKEVPIPIMPQAPAVPMPTPHYTHFEIAIDGGLKLEKDFSIVASTQNAEEFNVIVEGLDFAYPGTIPDTCCNFQQDAAATGIHKIATANTIASIFTADSGSNGATITAITIKALQSTQPGTVSLYLTDNTGGTPTWFLMQEISIPQTDQSSSVPSFKQVLTMNYNLQAGYSIGAATDIAQAFAITIEATNWTYPIS